MIRQALTENALSLQWSRISSVCARPLRFAGTGATAAAVQLALLLLFMRSGWPATPVYIAALILATQVNFVLSSTFTWRDRRAHSLSRRWLMYHASIGVMALLNVCVFSLASHLIPALEASMLGIAAGAVGNYLTGDKLVFRPAPGARVA